MLVATQDQKQIEEQSGGSTSKFSKQISRRASPYWQMIMAYYFFFPHEFAFNYLPKESCPVTSSA
ncbi:hypothetical protein FRX31_010076 [Thalictrum thalictroides]|uniref:Uncharacterized protein n=1 Tax=Thalictrum thalictroides TaxID=46969 RepID=A0A7J6WSH9_THATH|nr:hypothetical protein FRX31_010076 [Thalictrum thalictroides]